MQDKVKRDPEGYKQEFLQQYKHFLAIYQIYQLKPTNDFKEFGNLVKFLSAVAPCYPNDLSDFPSQISSMLEQNMLRLHPDLRKILVKSLILLRNRNLLSPTSLLSLFFKLFRCPDKALRVLLHQHIIADISKENSKRKSVELNKALQNFMYTMLSEESSTTSAPRESLKILIELFRKKIWNDKKTVNVISLGVFSKDSKMVGMTLQFFLSPPYQSEKKGSDDEEEVLTNKQVLKRYKKPMARKTRARERVLERKIKENKKKRDDKLKEEADDTRQYNHPAITMINDPQAFADKVFGALKSSNASFDIKIGMMNLISRLISANSLLCNNFYSFMQKYTQPHQQKITHILAILAQSIHPLVSPDVVYPLLKHIANTFVVDRRPSAVLAIGINTIREICLRSPLVMTDTLLKDLIQYKQHKDKGVMMAAKSLIGIFRAINPSLLPRRERGKDTDVSVKPLGYGEEAVFDGIEGTEYLDENGNLVVSSQSESEEEGDGWETASDNDGDSEEDENEADEAGDNEIKNESEGGDEEGDEDEDEGNEENEDNGKSEDKSKEDEKEDQENDSEINEDDMEELDLDDLPDDIAELLQEKFSDAPEEAQSEENNENDNEDENETENTADQATEAVEQKPRLEATKILTEEDWEKIKFIQEKQEQLTKMPKGKKRPLSATNIEDVDEENIVGYQKKKKVAKEDRMKDFLKEREEKRAEKKKFRYGSRKGGGSTTNIEKRKSKPYNMLRRKALKKQTRGIKQRLKTKDEHVKTIKSQRLSHH
uniref:Protein SDA1 n=1 Tax=Arcella intermedia TaxID=1963864 RepID=A0A6B2KY64_9EUKA